jgi:hypothetical protein
MGPSFDDGKEECGGSDREIARSLSLARITVPLTLAGLRR